MSRIPTPTGEVEAVLGARFEDVETSGRSRFREFGLILLVAGVFMLAVAVVATALVGTVATVAVASLN